MNKRVIQTPGAPAAPESTESTGADSATADTATAAPLVWPPSPEDLATMSAADYVAAEAAYRAQETNKAQAEKAAYLGVPPKLLRAIDVDPDKIDRAVLTADGWVCPTPKPSPLAMK